MVNLHVVPKDGYDKVDGGLIIVKVYDLLKQLGDETILPDDEKIFSEVSRDYGFQQTEKGYSIYGSLLVIDRKWLISLGGRCQSYLSDEYDKDLFVHRIDADALSRDDFNVAEYAKNTIQKSIYFKSSVLMSLYDGRLFTSPFFWHVGTVENLLKKSTLEGPEYKLDAVFLSSFRYPVVKKANYHSSLSDELFEIIEQILAQ